MEIIKPNINRAIQSKKRSKPEVNRTDERSANKPFGGDFVKSSVKREPLKNSDETLHSPALRKTNEPSRNKIEDNPLVKPSVNKAESSENSAASDMLSVRGLCVSAGKKPLVRDLSFSVFDGDFFMIVGPNGAGKTTIIRAICGEANYAGEINCRGQSLRSLPPRAVAKRIGVLSQKSMPSYAYTVREVVELGRYAYASGLIPRLSAEDKQAVDDALDKVQLAGFANRNIMTLSGGEYQRVLLAKLIAQDPQILILDEPSNHLDFPNQLRLMELLRDWLRQRGRAVLAVVHDFNLIKTYGTRGILLSNGGIAASGDIDEILSDSALKKVYETDVAGWMRDRLRQWGHNLIS